MDFLKKFNTETQYDLAKDDFEWATVSLLKDVDEVRYMTMRDKCKNEYLTFTALEDGTFTVRLHGTDKEGTILTSLSYSLDNGDTWTTSTTVETIDREIYIELETTEISATDTVLFKGVGSAAHATFTTNTAYNAYGNPMSLFYGDNFQNVTELWNSCFANMFIDSPIVSAENVYLGFTTLANYCYSSMFDGCTALTTAPELPATTLASSCYSNMFDGCTSLTTAPSILPATTLAQYCYQNMFDGCTSLTSAPELPATTLANYCYSNMFHGCTSLTSAPVLPATTLVSGCYNSMFDGCTSLTSAPELPATTLANDCYCYMFRNCTSLTTAPVLPATTLADYCYCYMFRNCTSLTTAPVLPATTLVSGCYNSMFYGCSSLNYIKAMFTTTLSGSTNTWVYGVSATGTFVKNSAAQWDVTGINGVPSGWVIELAVLNEESEELVDPEEPVDPGESVEE